MKIIFYLVLLSVSISCQSSETKQSEVNSENYGHSTLNKAEINCDDEACSGNYKGPEFLNGKDVAHQFSNQMCKVVGDKLKELYRQNMFSKVNFEEIEMQTLGMGSGQVTYTLVIPFEKVEQPCRAYTSFDHVGGWNHAPALERRKKELRNVTLANDTLVVRRNYLI